jgi:hypothetical protein
MLIGMELCNHDSRVQLLKFFFKLAHRYFTIQIPDVVREPGQLLKFIHGKTKPVANVLFAIFIGQALLGSVVTYWEAQSVITVNRKLALLEQQLENM